MDIHKLVFKNSVTYSESHMTKTSRSRMQWVCSEAENDAIVVIVNVSCLGLQIMCINKFCEKTLFKHDL